MFLVLIGGLLSAGAFAGVWLNLIVNRSSWAAALSRCAPQDWAGASGRCITGLEVTRAWYMTAGVAAGVLGGVAVACAIPLVIERRRSLRRLDNPRLTDLVDRLAQLAAEAGLHRPPRLVTAPGNALADPFTYGVPGHYRIAVPLKLVTLRKREPALVDAVLRHEIAHIRSGDVALAWQAVGVGYCVAGLLTVPLVAALVGPDHSLVVDYTWRALLLLAAVGLVQRSLLRAREHEADLSAVHNGVLQATRSAVARTRAGDTVGWRRLWRTHPDRADRLTVLDQPERLGHPTFALGLAAAFFVAVTTPLAHDLLVSALLTTQRLAWAWPVVAAGAGLFLGGSVGLALWRAAGIDRTCGTSPRHAPVVGGVAAGAFLGHAVSLAHTGLLGVGGETHTWSLVLGPLAVVVATLLAAGIAAAWAEVLPRLPAARRFWLTGLVVSGTGFALAIWVGTTTQSVLDGAGWHDTRRWVFSGLSSWSFVLVCALVAVVAAVVPPSREPAPPTPAWLVSNPIDEDAAAPPWPAAPAQRPWLVVLASVLAGLVGAATIAAFRIVAGPSTNAGAMQRLEVYAWIAAGVGAGVALAITVTTPRSGPVVAVLAAPVSALIAASTIVIITFVVGNPLTSTLVEESTRHVLAFVALTSGPAVAIGVVARTWVTPPVGTPGTLAATLGCAVLAALGAIAVGGTPPVAAGTVAAGTAAAGASAPPSVPATSTPVPPSADPAAIAAEARQYLASVALPMTRRFAQIAQTFNTLTAPPDSGLKARTADIRAQVIAPLVQLRNEMAAVLPVTGPVRVVHTTCTNALTATVEQRDLWTAWLERDDQQLLAQATVREEAAARDRVSCDQGIALLQQRYAGGAPPTAAPPADPATPAPRTTTTAPRPSAPRSAPTATSPAQQTAAVPNVGANPLATATQKLSAVGLKWRVVNVTDPVIPKGAVARTEPAPWSVVPKGSTVTLYVSS